MGFVLPIPTYLACLLRFSAQISCCRKRGIGKFTPEEIYTFGKKDLEALVTILGNKPYFFGD